VQLTVRYFAAARAAAGVEAETVSVQPGTTMTALVQQLSARSDELARVLQRCAFLCDGVAVRYGETVLNPQQTIDVLPPFAGG
jgi:sulfur-carrier protein